MGSRPQLESPFLERLEPPEDYAAPGLALLQSETPFCRALTDGRTSSLEASFSREDDQEHDDDHEAHDDEAHDDEAHDDEESFDELAPRADDEAASVAFDGEPEIDDWLRTEREDQADVPSAIALFAASVGQERARLNRGSAAEEERKLLADYRDTIAGARARFKKKFGQGAFTAEAIGRAWMVSRQEETGFLYLEKAPRMAAMAAPKGITLGAHPLVGHSSTSPVAPLTGRFMEEVRRRFPKVSAQNYPGHGSAGFVDLGHSLDLYIDGRDGRGFYQPAHAIDFLKAVHEAAGAIDARWRVIYNDFSVASAINKATGERNVIFVGKARKNKQGAAVGLNWHGPDPLVLHFHLDITPRSGDAARPKTISIPAAAPSATPAAATGAALVRFAQRILNAAENERLTVDGKLGPLTRAAVQRFRRRLGFGDGGLDTRAQVALVQRGLEELAQQSMFAPGDLDARTREEIARFKGEHGMARDEAIDEALYAALADAVEARARAAMPSTPAASRPAATAATTTTGADEQRMAEAMRLLVERYTYPAAAAAGIVGNLWAESQVMPNRIEGSRPATPMRSADFRGVQRDFTPEEVKNRDRTQGIGPRAPGIGLAQWTTPARRSGLFRHAFEGQVLDVAILDRMDAQVDYLVTELRRSYPGLNAVLRSADTSVDKAADDFVYNFEVPGAILDNGKPRRRLPRDNAAVQKVFRERRTPAHRALAAFNARQSEVEFVHEEHDVEEYFELG